MAQALPEKLEQTGIAVKESVISASRVSSWQGHLSRLFQKEEKHSGQTRSADHKIGESLWSENRTLAKKRRVKAETLSGKIQLRTERKRVFRGRKRASKENLPWKKYEWGGRKSSEGKPGVF